MYSLQATSMSGRYNTELPIHIAMVQITKAVKGSHTLIA